MYCDLQLSMKMPGVVGGGAASCQIFYSTAAELRFSGTNLGQVPGWLCALAIVADAQLD
jgi:hypothetical protein